MSDDEPSSDEPGDELEPVADAELVRPTSAGEIRPVEATGDGGASPSALAFIDRYRLASLRNRKELEAVEIVLDARIAEMRHQAESATKESKAYWDSRTADVVSAMKTFVQAKLRAVENDRMASRMDSMQSAYEMFAAKVREVETGSLPDDLRADLIQKMRQHLTDTIERLEKDALATKYDLGS